MIRENYWQECLEENTFYEDGANRTRIQWAVEQWHNRFPHETFALVKRSSSMTRSGWVHLMLPAFYVETYTRQHNYDDGEWFSITGPYYEILNERKSLIDFCRKGDQMAKKKTTKEPNFKMGQKIKRIDVFRLFDGDNLSWKHWDKEKKGWKRVPFKSKVKDLDFQITEVKHSDGGFTMFRAESKNWKMRWFKKPKDTGWSFLALQEKDLLKDNDILKQVIGQLDRRRQYYGR